MMRLDTEAESFTGRQDVWPSSVKGIMPQDNQEEGSDYLIKKVVTKMRKGLSDWDRDVTQQFMRPTAKPYQKLWEQVQEIFVAAVLYHSELIDDCNSFLSIPDAKCKEMSLTFSHKSLESLADNQKVVYQFWIICKKVNELLSWMANRIDGQKYFSGAIEFTVTIAKECITNAYGGKRRQQEELNLMREAEQESIKYNNFLKE